MQKVIFRTFKRGIAAGEVIALFPELPGTRDPATCETYMHIGQHSPASVRLVQDTRLATAEEYAPLFAELRGIGYDGLRIVKRFTYADYLARKAAASDEEV